MPGTETDWPLARPIALCLDALVCACAPYQGPLKNLWRRGGLHSRFETLFRVLAHSAPALSNKLTSAILKEVVIDEQRLKPAPMDRGRAVTVFRLPAPPAGQVRVLKVYRSSLGLSGKKLARLRENIQLGKDQLERWYGNCDGLLTPVDFVRLRSPILNIHALALIQPLVSTAAEDFFRTYSDTQLLDLLRSDEALQRQFDGFVIGTQAALQEGSRCFDMHGEKNLALISTAAGKRLCIVDYGVYDLEERKRKAPAAHAEILQMHERLFSLHRQLTANTD